MGTGAIVDWFYCPFLFLFAARPSCFNDNLPFVLQCASERRALSFPSLICLAQDGCCKLCPFPLVASPRTMASGMILTFSSVLTFSFFFFPLDSWKAGFHSFKNSPLRPLFVLSFFFSCAFPYSHSEHLIQSSFSQPFPSPSFPYPPFVFFTFGRQLSTLS